MDIDRLKGLVHRTVDIDVDETWSHYVGQGEAASSDEFLAFLKDQQLIDVATFVELHGQDDIELSDVPTAEVEPVDTTDLNGSRYDVLGPVAEGAMGVVHVAKDLDLRRKVAFKTMLRQGVLPRRRFLHEVQITAQLEHPNIVPVYSIEVDAEGRPAYAMKLVRGRTLTQIVSEARSRVRAKEPLPDDLALPARLDYFLKVCDAVAYAHSKGVIHRDLKPDNVMVGRFGEVYLMDWGIAKLVGTANPLASEEIEVPTPDEDIAADAHRRTRMGAVLGTPAYMSPEQAKGEVPRMGFHSDQFTLGLVLYELVHLTNAYGGDDAVLVLAKAAEARVDAPPTSQPAVPDELHAIIRRATSKDPTDRYPAVTAFEADVRRFLRGEETVAMPDTALGRVRRSAVRHPRVTFSLVAAIVVANLLLVAWVSYRRQVEIAEERLRSQVRGQRVAELVGAVSSRAQHIDNHFLWYEGMLEGIGAAAVYALEHGTPTAGPFYDASDYRRPDGGPTDLVFSPQYDKEVSATYPVYKVAPGISEEVWRRDLGVLDGLRDQLRHVFLVAPGDPRPPTTPEEQQARIVNAERSMRWAYVALEDSGLMYMFPGAAGWDEKYDARTRPWYREAIGRRGRVWGKPYVDLMGQGRLVSCLLPLYDSSGRFLGTAGIDLQFNELLDGLLKMTQLGGYQSAYLLDGDRVMLQTTAEDDPIVIPRTEVLDDGIDFGTFDEPAVVAGAKQGAAGHVLTPEQLLVWAPLQHQGWTYVVAVDPSTLGE